MKVDKRKFHNLLFTKVNKGKIPKNWNFTPCSSHQTLFKLFRIFHKISHRPKIFHKIATKEKEKENGRVKVKKWVRFPEGSGDGGWLWWRKGCRTKGVPVDCRQGIKRQNPANRKARVKSQAEAFDCTYRCSSVNGAVRERERVCDKCVCVAFELTTSGRLAKLNLIRKTKTRGNNKRRVTEGERERERSFYRRDRGGRRKGPNFLPFTNGIDNGSYQDCTFSLW